MKDTDGEKRLKAAVSLLMMDDVSVDTLKDIQSLIKGYNKKIDSILHELTEHINTLKSIHNEDTLSLSEKAAKDLPEDTKERKKRKKFLLLFITSWKDLRNEVKRAIKTLESEQANDQGSNTVAAARKTGSLIAKAKGPLGVVTLIATGIAAATIALNNISREIVIKNNGCQPLVPSVRLPIEIPGLTLPTEPINNGDQAVAKIPPLTFKVDNSAGNTIMLTALNFTMGFSLGSGGTDVTWNGTSLLGKTTTIDLGKQSSHTLIISCASR